MHAIGEVASLVAVTPSRIDRVLAHELWRYQWDGASLDRIELACEALEVGTSLYTVWKAPEDPVPLAVRFCRMKGSRHPERRRRNDLRTILGAPDRMLTAVHVPDEPADVVRELAVLVPAADRDRVLRGCLGPQETSRLLTWPAAGPAESPLGRPDEVRRHLRSFFERQPPSAHVAQALAQLALIEAGRPVPLSVARELVRPVERKISPWERLLFLSSAILHDLSTRSSTISDSGATGWPH
jgi:hypothetical protein